MADYIGISSFVLILNKLYMTIMVGACGNYGYGYHGGID